MSGVLLRTALFGLVLLPSTLFFSLCAVAGGLVGAGRGWYDWIHRSWARSLLGAAGVCLQVEGAERLPEDEARVLACNHQSLFDIWSLFAGVSGSVRFVAKAELARLPLFASACRAAGHVFIRRSRATEAIEGMRRAGEQMRAEGLKVAIFPEGTRSPDGRLRSFKRAPFLLAIETGVPVVPVAIAGGAAILRKKDWRVRPGTVTIRVGEPLPTHGLSKGDRERIAERVHREVARLLEDAREGGGRARPA